MVLYNSYFKCKDYIFDYYSNDNSEYCYVPILKNANSWGKELFKRGCDFEPTISIENKKYIVFFQDPYERWLSGIGQWFFQHCTDEEYNISPIMMEMIFDAVQLDGHTLPQIEYLDKIDLEKCTFFNLKNSNFQNYLIYFLKTYVNKNFIMPEISDSVNSSEKYKIKLGIQNQLKIAAENNPNLIQKVKHFYVEDYSLMNYCKFYNEN